MAVELDSLTIKDLEARYGVTRSNIYNRINGLKEKGYPMEPEKQAGKSIFNADQVAVMDRLDAHIKGGNEIATFPSNIWTLPHCLMSHRTNPKRLTGHRTGPI